MTDNIENPASVICHLVPEGERLAITGKLFGVNFPMAIEPVVFGITAEMAETYHGGYWHFYTLDNGGFYMAPDDDRVFAVSCNNMFRGELSADALGIVACLYAYSHLSFTGNGDFPRVCASQYHLLRHYMFNHAEFAAILRATD